MRVLEKYPRTVFAKDYAESESASNTGIFVIELRIEIRGQKMIPPDSCRMFSVYTVLAVKLASASLLESESALSIGHLFCKRKGFKIRIGI